MKRYQGTPRSERSKPKTSHATESSKGGTPSKATAATVCRRGIGLRPLIVPPPAALFRRATTVELRSPLFPHGSILSQVIDPANGRNLTVRVNPATRHPTQPGARSFHEHVRRLVGETRGGGAVHPLTSAEAPAGRAADLRRRAGAARLARSAPRR